MTQQSTPLARPQTASIIGRKKDDFLLNDDDLLEAQSQFDKELNELLAKNQRNLMELHNDFKEVSKITGEATINVRKIGSTQQRKVLKHNDQENQIDSSSAKIV